VNFTVVNRELYVGNIKVTGVATSSVFLIGDSEVITCSSVFDTPPESLVIGAVSPLESEQEKKDKNKENVQNE
jgi:spore germination protein PD